MLHRARVSIWRLLFLLLQLPTVSRQSPPLMPCQFTSVWTASHHRVCLSTASRSPVQLIRGGICVPPTVMPYRVSGSTLTAVGRSQLLARWPGTHFRISSGIQRAAQTLLGVYLKRTCSRVTSASSASGVLTIMHCTNPHTHSLTHSLNLVRQRWTLSAINWRPSSVKNWLYLRRSTFDRRAWPIYRTRRIAGCERDIPSATPLTVFEIY